MVVGWLTATTLPSTVQYGTSSGSYSQSATGTVDSYKYSSKYTSGQIHHATLTGLKPSTIYYYKVAGATAEYNFTSSPGVGAFYPYKIGAIPRNCDVNGPRRSTSRAPRRPFLHRIFR